MSCSSSSSDVSQDFSNKEAEERGLIKELNIGKIEDAIIHNLKGLDRLKLPDNAIKFDADAILSRIKEREEPDKLYEDGWVNFPMRETPTTERHEKIKNLFNNIGEDADRTGNPTHVVPCRQWAVRCTTCNKIAPCSEHTGPTCLALVNGENAEPADWGNMLTVVECELGPVIASKNATLERLAKSAQFIFQHQPDRSYVLCAALCNDEIAMVVFNRGGVHTSDWFNIHTSPTRFIRNLVGLMTVERAFLGFDPNMKYTKVGARPACTVKINGNEYVLEELIANSDNVRGRATSCWRISRDGKTFVLKDAWFKLGWGGKVNEVEILRIIQGIEGVPELIEYEVCKDAGGDRHYTTMVDLEDLKADKALTMEQQMKVWHWDHYCRVRIVTAPYATWIRAFKSRRELLYALITIVDTMEKLYERDVLHRDISRYNIMLGTKTNEYGERRGLLIDYDFAIHPSDHFQESPCMIGTVPFMARDYLCRWRSHPRIHKYYHDLESFFYVICYIFTTSAGPDGVFIEDIESIMENSVVGKWSGFANESLEYMGSWKSSRCQSERLFERVINEFADYFKEDALKRCMRDLRELVFDEVVKCKSAPELRGEDCTIGVTYLDVDDREPKEYFWEFKRILQEAYDNLEETKSMAQQKELNKNPCDGQEQVMPKTAVVVGTQEPQNDVHAPENSVATVADKPDVEAPVNDADIGMGDASRPVFELANPSSSASNHNHENEAIPDANASKKRKRTSDTQEGESESPAPKRATSDKENVTDKNLSKLNANGAGKPPNSQNGELERRDLPREPEHALGPSKIMNTDEGAE